MSELLISLLRFGFLVALWLLVISVVAVLRRDIVGTRVTSGSSRAGSSLRERVGGRLPAVVGGRSTSGASASSSGAGGSSAGASAPSSAPRVPRRSQQRPVGPSKLVVIDGPLTGTTIPLASSSILAGRAPSSTLVLDDDFASSRHARFFPQGSTWFVEDLGSTNGTTVGGAKVSGTPVEVPVGTPVRIGRTTVELRR